MEEQKKRAILDKECIHCVHFFTCTGKAEKGQLCVRYEEREGSECESRLGVNTPTTSRTLVMGR